MILRKPYAMLIKYFRVIHAVLTLLLVFILFKTGSIHTFLVNYIKDSSNLRIYIDPSITSISLFVYLSVLLSILFFSVIFALMRKKDKPVKFYLISILYYSLLMVLLLLSNAEIIAISQSRATLQLARIVRDLLGLFYYLQYIFVFVSLFRTIGFNIKKFDFQSDLKELKIMESDNEEFELDFEIDSNDIKTKFKRYLRILKYFVQENKKILMSVTGITLFFGVLYIVLNITIYNKIYTENETFNYNNMNMKILSSYQDSKSYTGRDISNDEYLYCIAKVEIDNTTEETKSINMSNVELDVSGIKTYPVDTKNYNSFKDIGVGYSDYKLEAKTKNEYIFVFKIDKDYKDNNKILKFIREIKTTSKGDEFVYTKIKLKPIDSVNPKIVSSAVLNETLQIDDNLIGKFNIKIESYEFVDNATYEYKEKINNKEYTFTKVIVPDFSDYYGKKILKLKADIEELNIWNSTMSKKILGNFTTIRYMKNGKEYISPFNSKEHVSFDENEYKYLEVYDKITEIDADEIYMDIIIRNNKYIYKLK